jgi:hypothetical protein
MSLDRFDVKRSDRDAFSVATVTKVDFSGTTKRIMFHFAKTSSDRDEWVEFGSSRIAPLYSIVSRTTQKGAVRPKLKDKARPVAVEGKKEPIKVQRLRPLGKQLLTDPSNEESFVIGGKLVNYCDRLKLTEKTAHSLIYLPFQLDLMFSVVRVKAIALLL